MREFDINGIRLAEYQANLFEKSVERFDCSTKIFLRRFLLSDILKTLDQNESAFISMTVDEALSNIEDAFGKTNYGKIKYSPDTMFWMGYLYRYISYTRDINTKLLFKFFKPELLNELYSVYHTQDMEWCIANLLELNDLTEDIFDKNKRLKEVIKRLSVNIIE